jgi:outer membrane receptor protein involved in Fe transport
MTVDHIGPWFGALRFRYFGSRPLIEDNSVRSAGSLLSNLRLGYRLDKRTQLALDVYNLFDRTVNDIEYWYETQLAGEAAPLADRHIHPTEPRTFRLSIRHQF